MCKDLKNMCKDLKNVCKDLKLVFLDNLLGGVRAGRVVDQRYESCYGGYRVLGSLAIL